MTAAPTLAEIIAAIKAREAGKQRRPGDPVPWDVRLADEIVRLRCGIQDAYADIDGLTAPKGSGDFGRGFVAVREFCLEIMREVARAAP